MARETLFLLYCLKGFSVDELQLLIAHGKVVDAGSYLLCISPDPKRFKDMVRMSFARSDFECGHVERAEDLPDILQDSIAAKRYRISA